MALTYWDWHTPNSLDPPLKAVDGGGVGILLEQPIMWGPRALTDILEYTPNGRNQHGSRNCTAGPALDTGYEDRSYHFATPPSTISTGSAVASKYIAIIGSLHRKKAVSVFFRLSLADVSGENFIMAMGGGNDGSATSPYADNPTMSLWCENGFLKLHYGGSSYSLSAKVADTLNPVSAATTHKIEVGVVRDATAGEIRVYMDDVQVFALTGLVTKSGSQVGIGKVWWAHFRYSGGAVTAGGGANVSGMVIRCDADVLTDADFFFEQNVTPHISASRVVSQGHYNDLAADVSALDETTFTESGDSIAFAGGSIPKQSWLGTASLPIAAAGGSVLGFVGRVVFSDGDTNTADNGGFVRDYCQVFLRIASVDYESADATNATNKNNATLQSAPAVMPYYTAVSRYWLTNPATLAAWGPSELDGLEWGCRLCSGWSGVSPTWTGEQNAEALTVAFAFGEILWTASNEVPIDVECVPPETGACDVMSDAWFVDAGKLYDGRDPDGSATTFEDIGNGTDDGDTVGINVDLVGTFSAEDVGKRIRLTIGGVGYDATVTTIIGTRGIEATLEQDVPLAAVGVATTNWAFVVNTMELPWLEGEDVNVLGDGIPRYFDAAKPPTKYAVSGGTLTLNDYYGVIIAGLPRISDAELLDLDADGGAVFRDRKKLTGKVGVLVEYTRQFHIGQVSTDLTHWPVDPFAAATSLALPTRTTVVNVKSRTDVPGRLLIRQVEPLPLSLLGVIHEVAVGGRGNV